MFSQIFSIMRARALQRGASVLFVLAIAFTLFMALEPYPPRLPIDALGDKFEHMLAFGTLTLLARLAFTRMSSWRILERMSFFGALIEVFQAIPSLHRDCDWKDWVADTLAAAGALVLAEAARRRGMQAVARAAAESSAAHG